MLLVLKIIHIIYKWRDEHRKFLIMDGLLNSLRPLNSRVISKRKFSNYIHITSLILGPGVDVGVDGREGGGRFESTEGGTGRRPFDEGGRRTKFKFNGVSNTKNSCKPIEKWSVMKTILRDSR